MWVYGELRSGQIIDIFDIKVFDLREYVNQEVDLLIIAWLGEVINIEDPPQLSLDQRLGQKEYPTLSSIIKGRIIENYKLPKKFSELENGVIGEVYNNGFAMETDDGIFLLDEGGISGEIKEGDEVAIDFGRFEIVAWYCVPEKLKLIKLFEEMKYEPTPIKNAVLKYQEQYGRWGRPSYWIKEEIIKSFKEILKIEKIRNHWYCCKNRLKLMNFRLFYHSSFHFTK